MQGRRQPDGQAGRQPGRLTALICTSKGIPSSLPVPEPKRLYTTCRVIAGDAGQRSQLEEGALRSAYSDLQDGGS